MITDLYKANSKTKMPDNTSANNGQQNEVKNSKRKSLPVSVSNNKQMRTENMTNMEKLELLKQSNSQSQNRKQSNNNNTNNGLTKSLINFDMFACDQDLKENIFRRIYYILSPEHFLSNGKIPPRGFLLHGI